MSGASLLAQGCGRIGIFADLLHMGPHGLAGLHRVAQFDGLKNPLVVQSATSGPALNIEDADACSRNTPTIESQQGKDQRITCRLRQGEMEVEVGLV